MTDGPKDPPATAPEPPPAPEPRPDPGEPRPDPGGGGPPKPRARTAFGAGGWWGWVRRFAKLWGFLGFCLLVLVLFRHVILPFIFSVLLAYVLSPVIRKMSSRADGSTRMPRGVSIILVYIVVLALMSLFVVALLPRISRDVERIGREAPSLYKKVNEQWAPQLAQWLEARFPSLRPPPVVVAIEPPVADVPLPPGTQFVLTPLPDGRYAVEFLPAGLELKPRTGGGYTVTPAEEPPEEVRTEDKIRRLAGRALLSIQAEFDDLFRFGRQLVTGTINVVFKFFLVLMIAAFLLLDLEKFHTFGTRLIPEQFADDYQAVVTAIDKGLSGVIRGQLTICVLNGVLTYIGMLIFDVKYSLILAVVATLLSLIPIFGTILSSIPIVLAALVSADAGVDVMRGVFILAWILGIHFLEANIFNPKIMGTAAKIHPVMVIFALLAGEHSYGLVGALLAVPVASIIQVLFTFFRDRAWRAETAS